MHAIRTVLVGYGYAGRTFHAPLIQACAGLELAAVVSSDPVKVRADHPHVRVVATLDEALADPAIGLVVIAAPNAAHAALAEAALAAGRHVVVDKPFTVTTAEARALIAQAAQVGRLLSVFHNRRWDGDFLQLQALRSAGTLGELVVLESRFDRFRPQPRVRWREQQVAGGGIWFDLGPHLVDQALTLFGLPTRVHAQLAALRPGAQVDDWAQVQLDYGTRKVTLSASMLVGGGLPRFAAHGTRGSWIKHGLDPQEGQLLAGGSPGEAGWGLGDDGGTLYGADAPQQLAPRPGAYQCYYQQVAAALRGEGENPVPAEQALAVMAVIEAAQHSARDGAWVRPAVA